MKVDHWAVLRVVQSVEQWAVRKVAWSVERMAALSVAWKAEQMAAEMAELMVASMVDYWAWPRAEKTGTVMAEQLVAL